MSRPDTKGLVLVCAPFGRDGESVVELLRKAGYHAEVCADLNVLAARMDDATGALVMTEEAMRAGVSQLDDALEGQDTWSDVPILLLTAPRARAVSWPKDAMPPALPVLRSTNIVVLERPLGIAPLVSAVASALRARAKQYEIRDSLDAQTRAAEHLDAQVKARTHDLEQALSRLQAEVEERELAEEALRQSQKMEAVGQLTGGIAHDFNNMLTGVIGSLDIIRRRIATGRLDDIDRFMEGAATSAQRAANLTQRLLAFSRRQSLDSRAIDANALVRSLEELLVRTMGENIAIRLELSDFPGLAMADANQLESAILNLAINARDAMPDGGRLTVATTRVKIDAAPGDETTSAGDFVVISIADTGAGMSDEVCRKVFDPFFTTKPIGQGTGLGLSMVYGFAKQSGGKVEIASTLGQGTSVSIFLPVAKSDARTETALAPPDSLAEGAGERVLIVEDEHAVRQLLCEALTELGYATEEVGDAQGALELLAGGRHFDLLISDVGLPGLNGRQLAEEARRNRPDMPILFVTGYAENAAIRARFLGTNMSMITKPFSLDIVADKVREMLGHAGKPAPRERRLDAMADSIGRFAERS